MCISLSYSSNIVNEIEISGNEKTPTHIIINQVKHPLNINFNNQIAKEDQQRIYDLDIFQFVNIRHNNTKYVIVVQEKKNISFKPLFKKIDGLGWTYGTYIQFNNIKGTTNQLHIGLGTGKIDIGKINFLYKSPFQLKEKMIFQYNIDKKRDIDDQYNLSSYATSMIYNKKNNFSEIKLKLQHEVFNLNFNNNTGIKYSYLSQNFIYNLKKNINLVSSELIFNIKNSISSNSYKNFQTFNLNYQYINTFNDKKNSPTINLRSKIYVTSNNNIPIFAMEHMGGDEMVRGYEPQLSLNPEEVRNKLKFNNYIFGSIQFEIPWFQKNSFNTNIIFFVDQAVGSNQNDSFNNKNRIIGYGFGYNIITKNKMQFDIHVGLNKYQNNVIHFMVKRNV